MASVITGSRRHRASLDQPLTRCTDDARNATRERDAQVTAAEHAIADGWVPELGEVLDALGLRGAS